MSIFHRFITNISWNIVGKSGVMAASLGLSILITRYLGKERFGVYATLLVVPGFIRLINSFGLEMVVNKKIPELNIVDPSLQQGRHLLKQTFAIRFATTLGFSIALYFVLPLYLDLIHLPELLIYRTPIIFYFALTSINSLYSTLFMTLLRYKTTSIVELVNYLLNLGLLIVFIYLDWAISGVLCAYIIATGLNLAVYVGLSLKDFEGNTQKPRLDDVPNLAWIAYWTTLFRFGLLMQCDLILMNYFQVDLAQVGFYQLAMMVCSMLTFLLMGIHPLALSLFSETYAKDSIEGLLKSWRLIVTFFIFFTLPIYGFVFVNAQDLLVFVYGGEYSAAAVGLSLYLVFLTLEVICGGSFYAETLFAMQKNRVVMHANIEGSLLNIILNIILIPKYAELGAITGTGLSIIYMVGRQMAALYAVIPIKVILVSTMKFFLLCLIPLTFSFLIAKLTEAHVLVNLGCYAFVFFIFLAWLKPVTETQARYVLTQFPGLENWMRLFAKSDKSSKDGRNYL